MCNISAEGHGTICLQMEEDFGMVGAKKVWDSVDIDHQNCGAVHLLSGGGAFCLPRDCCLGECRAIKNVIITSNRCQEDHLDTHIINKCRRRGPIRATIVLLDSGAGAATRLKVQVDHLTNMSASHGVVRCNMEGWSWVMLKNTF